MSEEEIKTEGISKEDIDAINKDIDDAKDKLVSKETDEKIEKAKAEAKAEAEKEFYLSQKAKELEEENKKLKEQMEAKEKEAAEKLTELTNKVNDYVESKAVISNDNPLDKVNADVEKLDDEEIAKIEDESFKAFIEERVKKD